MSVQNGDIVLVEIGGVQVGALVTNGHNQLADMLDASNKDTPGVKQYQAGETGWTFSLEALFDPAATEGVSEALGYLKAGTLITVTHGITGTSIQSGSGYISSLECSGPKNEISSYSLEIQGTGAVSTGFGPELHTDANAISDPNGNETDATTGWNQIGLTGTGSNVFESQNSVVHTGSYAFHTNANDTPYNGCQINKTFTGLENGATYEFRLYIRHVGTGGEWRINVDPGDGFVNQHTIETADTTFEYVSFQVTVVGTEIEVVIRESDDNAGGVYVDNFSMKKVL